MRQTLFFIPDQVAGLPMFGFGLLLALWLIGASVALWFMVQKQGWDSDTKGFLPFIGLVAAAITFLLPAVMTEVMPHELGWMLWQTGAEVPRGLPIRGYGVFLLLATLSGVGLAVWRAKSVGLSPDVIFSLAFNMFIGGIIGARLFFIIQYWDDIHVPGSLGQTIANIVNFVEGGLVVYGSLIGASLTAIWYLSKNKLPLLAIADLVAPSLPLGLAIGRLGCLMNGCCYGGVCEQPWALTFPPQSPPYHDQQRHGEFYGFRIVANEAGQPIIGRVSDDGQAAAVGLKPGMQLEAANGYATPTMLDAMRQLSSVDGNALTLQVDGQPVELKTTELPQRSYPVHPTQLYSAFNATLLCLVCLAWFPFRRRDGEVFAALIAMYAVTRFLLEVIRTDEGGFGGTGMTISQNVSVMMLVGVALLAWFVSRQPRGSFWPQPAEQAVPT